MIVRVEVKSVLARCTVGEWLRSEHLQLLERRLYIPPAVAQLQEEVLETFLRTDLVFLS